MKIFDVQVDVNEISIYSLKHCWVVAHDTGKWIKGFIVSPETIKPFSDRIMIYPNTQKVLTAFSRKNSKKPYRYFDAHGNIQDEQINALSWNERFEIEFIENDGTANKILLKKLACGVIIYDRDTDNHAVLDMPRSYPSMSADGNTTLLVQKNKILILDNPLI